LGIWAFYPVGNHDGWGMMASHRIGFWGDWLMLPLTLIFWGLFVWAIVAAERGSTSHRIDGSEHQDESALEILKRRYVSGEINKEEYEEKRKDLLQ